MKTTTHHMITNPTAEERIIRAVDWIMSPKRSKPRRGFLRGFL
jgi:hypothetical protein